MKCQKMVFLCASFRRLKSNVACRWLAHGRLYYCTIADMRNLTVGGTIMSGIQPSGSIHIGNYFGALQHWRKLQDDNCNHPHSKTIFGVMDLHALTLPLAAAQCRENLIHSTAALLASGISPEKSIIFQQSRVLEVCELSWILSCQTPLSTINNLPEWKEKSQAHQHHYLGLYSYPVLQAADILIYRTNHVPVGDDQSKHIDIARKLARRFNARYDTDCLVPPQELQSKTSRLKSLLEPASKMSKSDDNAMSRICLSDTPDSIASKIRRAVTDCTRVISYDPVARAGVSNLIDIYCCCTGEDAGVCGRRLEAGGVEAGPFKERVVEALVHTLTPIRQEIERLEGEGRDYLLQVLEQGSGQARDIATHTLTDIKRVMGMQ